MAGLDQRVRELLEGPNFPHVATLLPDGTPHVTPVWTGVEGDRVFFFTQRTNRKARNLDRDPRVAISVADRANPYRSADIRGRVVERRTGEEALAGMDRICAVYTGKPFPLRDPSRGVLYLVEPEHVGYTELKFEPPPVG